MSYSQPGGYSDNSFQALRAVPYTVYGEGGMKRQLVFGAAMMLVSACGSGRPTTYEECLVDLGKQRPAAEAIVLCERAFPKPMVALDSTPFFSGEFHYPSTGAQCGLIAFSIDGTIVPGRTGFCGPDSRIECEGGSCRLVCRNVNSSDSALVRYLLPDPEGILVTTTPTASTGAMLHRKMSSCELEMTVDPSDRNYSRWRRRMGLDSTVR